MIKWLKKERVIKNWEWLFDQAIIVAFVIAAASELLVEYYG